MIELAFAAWVACSEVRIVDGDTFWCDNEKIRVAGIDTPEPSKYGNAECLAEAILGDSATRFAKMMLSGGSVTIQRVGEDKYGRTLANVKSHGEDYAAYVLEGLVARPYEGAMVDWCGPIQGDKSQPQDR